MFAVASPVTVLVAPGPEVTTQQPGLPVARAYPSAMWTAPCSWRARTNWNGASYRLLKMSSAAPPG